MRKGGRPVVSAHKALAHIDALQAKFPGLTRRHIARLAGIAESTLCAGRQTMRIDPDTEERVLAVTLRHVALMPPPEMPAHIARAHIARLIEETGMSRNAVARAAGVNYQTVYNIMKPGKPIVKRSVHEAIVNCTVDDLLGINIWTDRRPSITRLRALQANQWSLHRLGEQYGMNLSVHANSSPDLPIETRVARRIQAMYEYIGDEVGPSPLSAAWARKRGALTPIHYDEDMNLIEVAEETPAQVAQDKARADLCILGQTVLDRRSIARIVDSLRVSERRVTATRRRAGIALARTLDGEYEPIEARPGVFGRVREAVRSVHYRSTLDCLDTDGLDYVALLAVACGEKVPAEPVAA